MSTQVNRPRKIKCLQGRREGGVTKSKNFVYINVDFEWPFRLTIAAAEETFMYDIIYKDKSYNHL